MTALKQMVEDNFEIYAGMVIQKRALVDVRDCLKPSARQLMYAQYIDKIDFLCYNKENIKYYSNKLLNYNKNPYS